MVIENLILTSGGLPTSQTDFLFCACYNSRYLNVITLRARTLTPEGEIVPTEIQFTPTIDRSYFSVRERLPIGLLLSIVAVPKLGNLRNGECYLTLGLTRNIKAQFEPYQILAQGYLTSNNYISWPKADSRTNTEGPGWSDLLTPADPAAGDEVSYIVPTNTRQKISGFRFTLTTTATVANRGVVLRIAPDGSNVLWYLESTTVQPASTTYAYIFSTHFPVLNAFTSVVEMWMPEIILGQSALIDTVTANLDVAAPEDAFSNVRIYSEFWIEE